jgi:hypothetical protein
MGSMSRGSRAIARRTKEWASDSGVARHGRRLVGFAIVGALGVSPSVVQQSSIESPVSDPASIEKRAGNDLDLTRGEAVSEAVFQADALLDPVPLLENKTFGFTALGSAARLVDDVSAGYALRPFGQTAVRRFNLSPIASYTSIAASQPKPVAPSGKADMVTGSIPKEPEPVSRLELPAPLRESAELGVPLPVPRPVDAPEPLDEIRNPQSPRGVQTVSPALPEPDNRTLVQKLFGLQRSGSQSVAYAPPTPDERSKVRPSLLSSLFGSTTQAAPGTAVYDISARTVYLPSGEKLEAHSGLGDKRDDPRHVSVRMHGATPPHVYDLTEREQLFHGVEALRLTPVGGSGAIHGRVGLLAHSYLLGPAGDSNGCLSVKDYNRFLQAYRRGEIRRLVVVASAS